MAGLADFYLLGIGIRGMKQVSLETIDALRKCRKIYHLTDEHRQLKRINPNVVNWGPHYWVEQDYDIVYQRLLDCLLEEVSKGPGVGSVIYGHPLFFDDVHMEIREISKRRGLRCVVLPGVSSLDTLSIDLGIDYGDGLLVVEADDIVENSIALNPDLHTLIFQIGEFGMGSPGATRSTGPDRFMKIEKYLLKFYEPQQRIVIAYSDDGHGDGSVLLKSRLGRLSTHHRRMFSGTTLYIPPASA